MRSFSLLEKILIGVGIAFLATVEIWPNWLLISFGVGLEIGGLIWVFRKVLNLINSYMGEKDEEE